MDEERQGSSPLLMVGGMALCCGLPLIVASGVLAGAGTWFLAGGWLAIAAGAIVVVAGFYLRGRRGAPGRSGEIR